MEDRPTLRPTVGHSVDLLRCTHGLPERLRAACVTVHAWGMLLALRAECGSLLRAPAFTLWVETACAVIAVATLLGGCSLDRNPPLTSTDRQDGSVAGSGASSGEGASGGTGAGAGIGGTGGGFGGFGGTSCSSGDCVCAAGGNCNFPCDVNGCSATCGANGNCSVSCANGGCTIDCAANSSCSLDCPGGNCSVMCQFGSSCSLTNCPGGNCTCSGC